MKIIPISNDELDNAQTEIKNPFDLTEEDLNGDIEDFPVGVIVRMMEEQKRQGNKPDITVFQKSRDSSKAWKGFDWSDSENHYQFWYDVIKDKDFDLFFEKYPEYRKITRHDKNRHLPEYRRDSFESLFCFQNIKNEITFIILIYRN